MHERSWYKVEIRDYDEFKRPEAQGGRWFVAKHMRVLEPVGRWI
jgi:hypothetical protein